MSRPKRSSISGLFPGIDVPPSPSRSDSRSPTRTRTLAKTLRGTFSRNWPKWDSVRDAKQINFTIRIDDVYREMAPLSSPKEHFTRSQKEMQDIIELHKNSALAENERFYQALEDMMIQVVFGSNYVERAGTTFNVTLQLCRSVFGGLKVEPAMDVRDPLYLEGLTDFINRHVVKEGENPNQMVVRSRVEVIQHAKALDHIVHAMVDQNELLSEGLIKDTHHILCTGIDHADDTPSEGWAGQYRDGKIAAKNANEKKAHHFIQAKAVPFFMHEMCESYKNDVREIEESKELDPYTLAARYAWYYVNIHPFWDGNGRMCRLIMNAILLKYAGFMVPIGENGDAGRDEYLDVCTEGSKNFLNDDWTSATDFGHRSMGALIIKKATLKLKEFRDRL